MLRSRSYNHLDLYLNKLMQDIYPQPEDDGHTRMAKEVFDNWIRKLVGVKTVLDVGCGDTGFMQKYFESIGIDYSGIAIGVKETDKIKNMDFTFTSYPDNTFDLIFARHSLEHSPMPILTLMEWNRICSGFLCLVNPDPNHYGFGGLNHYSVATEKQINDWLRIAGWKPIWTDRSEFSEIRIMCEKVRDEN